MATYIVGDIQGCYNELQALLAQVNFTKGVDGHPLAMNYYLQQ